MRPNSAWPQRPADEVVERLDLALLVRPFSRCAAGDGRIEPVQKAQIAGRLEPKTKMHSDVFYRRPDCGKIFW